MNFFKSGGSVFSVHAEEASSLAFVLRPTASIIDDILTIILTPPS